MITKRNKMATMKWMNYKSETTYNNNSGTIRNWNLFHYNFNKSVLFNNKQVYEYIEKVLELYFGNLGSKTLKLCYIISKPVITMNFNKIVVRFFIYKNNGYSSLINNEVLNVKEIKKLESLLSNKLGKDVEFKMIRLRLPYLNSMILSKYLGYKMKNERVNFLRLILKLRALITINEPKFHKVNRILQFRRKFNDFNRKYRELYLCDLKYKFITGLRLELSGRMSKRLSSARSRSLSKLYGSLSLDNKVSENDILIHPKKLRGIQNINSDVYQYSNKNRNGAFGLHINVASKY